MLVLTEIYKIMDNKFFTKLDCISISKVNIEFKGRLDCILRFDIYDTNTKKLSSFISLDDIRSKIRKLLGVVYYNNVFYFLKVSKNLLNLLDYIVAPKFLGNAYSSDILKVDNDTLDKESSSYKIEVYNNLNKRIIVYNLLIDYNILDSNFIFWKENTSTDNNFYTIFDFYNEIFNIGINENTDVYIKSIFGDIYKLDINKNVIRYMTKLKLLKG